VPWVARRYAAGRPDLHGELANHVRRRVAPGGGLARGVDVGCGTGLSSRAFRSFVDCLVGVDPSAAMLAEARAGGGPDVRGRAEALPIATASLDLVTIGCAWHWCEAGPLLAEAARVLRPGGWLVVYDSELRGAPERPELIKFLRSHYWSALDRVARHPAFDPTRRGHPAFSAAASELLEQDVAMTRSELKTLITSQASTAGNVERGLLDLTEAEARLERGLAPCFTSDAERLMLRFDAPIHYLRRKQRGR
jgi:SAM-dependent methyltransferase